MVLWSDNLHQVIQITPFGNWLKRSRRIRERHIAKVVTDWNIPVPAAVERNECIILKLASETTVLWVRCTVASLRFGFKEADVEGSSMCREDLDGALKLSLASCVCESVVGRGDELVSWLEATNAGQ